MSGGDIVDRLRSTTEFYYGEGVVVLPVCAEAANEIERLRAENAEWRNQFITAEELGAWWDDQRGRKP